MSHRPLRAPTSVFLPEEKTQEPTPAPGRPWLLPGIVFGAFALVVIVYVLGQGQRTSATPAATYLSVISRHELKGEWDTAASTAEAALNDPALLPSDKPALAKKVVDDTYC